MTDKNPRNDPLLVEIFRKLPPIGSTWPLDERVLWLTTCEAALNLIYGPVERVVIDLPGMPFVAPAPKRAAPEVMSTAAGAALLQGDAELEVVGDETSAGIQPTEAALKALAPSTPSTEQLAETPAPKPRERPGPKPADVASTPRPAGIPTTFAMVQEVLTKKPGLTSREVVAAIAGRWWPGLQLKAIGPDISTAVTHHRLQRDADGRLYLTEKGKNLSSVDLRLTTKGQQPPQPKVADVPAPRVAPAPVATVDAGIAAAVQKIESKPKPVGTIKFEHDGRTTMLSTGREYSIAGKLRAAMGKGHVAEAFLAETVLGSNTENNRLVVRDICRNLCTPLAAVGLTIEHYPGFGLVMKEV